MDRRADGIEQLLRELLGQIEIKVTIPRFAELSGYTEEAVRKKIERGIWLEGVVWFRAPDGRKLISVKGFNAWIEGRECGSMLPASASRGRRTCTL